MFTHDPYDPGPVRTYECPECATRVEADSQPVDCPDCGARLWDLSVPRE